MESTTLLKFGFCTKCAGGTQGSFPVLFASNFRRPYLSRPNSVWGVLRLYGKPIESIFFPCAFGRQWVSTTLLKIYETVHGTLLSGERILGFVLFMF